MRYTIEARQLTSESSHRPAHDAEWQRMTIEAAGPAEAISEFIRDNASELVSLAHPVLGRESIAMVKKDDSVFLVRVYRG